MKKRTHFCTHGIYYIIAAFILSIAIFLGLCRFKGGSYGSHSVMKRQPSRKAQAVIVPESSEVESASAGEPYQVFIDQNGREPKNRYEYKLWLKKNFTTDWEYWYDRYREYRAYQDGFAPGSGPFKYKGHAESQ